MSLPTFGHLGADRGIRGSEPIGRVGYIPKGKHMIIGQRERRGNTEDLIYLGKCIEHTTVQDRYDANIWFDVSFPHVISSTGS